MNKKFISIVCIFTLIATFFAGFSGFANDGNLVKNGGFEALKDGIPENWRISGGNLAVSKDSPNEGINSAKISGAATLSQTITVEGGKPYVLEGFAKGGVLNAVISFSFVDGTGTKRLYDSSTNAKSAISANTSWQKFSLSFTSPAKAQNAEIQIKLESGEAYLDNISVIFDKTSPALLEEEKIKELIVNGSFETINNDGTPYNWFYSDKSGTISIANEKSKDQKNSLKLKADSKGLYVSQHFTHLVATTTYDVSLWIKAVNADEAIPKIKMEYFKMGDDGKEAYLDELTQTINVDKIGSWVEYGFKFKAPRDIYSANILLRLDGVIGEIYYDNVSVKGERLASYVETPVPTNAPAATPKPSTEVKVPYNDQTAKEFIKNGDFEEVSEGSPSKWTFGKGAYSVDYKLDTENPQNGKNALILNATDKDLYIAQSITSMAGSAEYKVKLYVRSISLLGSKYPQIKFEFYGVNDLGASVYLGDHAEKYTTVVKDGAWQEWTFSFVSPEGTIRANAMFRLQNIEASLAYDNISVKGADASKSVVNVDPSKFPKVEVKTPFNNAKELIHNGGFEILDSNGVPEGWTPYKNTWSGNPYVSLNTEVVHSGKNSVKVTTDEGGNPWVCYMMDGLIPLTEYQMSVWIRTPGVSGNGISYKFEYYNNPIRSGENGVTGGKETAAYVTFATGDYWFNMVQSFTPPKGATSVAVYLRLYADGVVYFDDASCYQTGKAKAFDLITNDVYYYTDEQSGIATVKPDFNAYPQQSNRLVDFKLLDGETVLEKQLNTAITADTAKFKFYTSDLYEKGKEYIIEATMKSPSGEVIETKTKPVYRYDRPKNLREDGVYLKDGKPFDPIFMYHVKPEEYSKMAEVGVNVVQGSATKEVLDKAQANGLMVLVALYEDMLPAGHPANAEKTKERVSNLKDHPAVFAWAIMDEPFYNDPECEPHLLNSYKIIRDIDPVHPVYLVEDGNNFETAAKYTDLFGIDPYPAAKHAPTVHISDRTSRAQAGTTYRKPVLNLLQAFSYNGYFPTQDDLRNMLYQALFEGSTGVGYYEFGASLGNIPLDKTELWPTMASWYKNEAQEAFKYFVHGEYPTFNDYRGENVWWRSYVKDGNIYMYVLNRSDKNEVSAEIPLLSTSGIKIGGYKALVYAGGDATNLTGDGTLNVTLKKSQAVVYKITPTENVDFSGLIKSKFIDTASYTWARAQIEDLEAKGIVYGISEKSFGPGTKITRGDFAAFLIKTLGLTADTGDNFSDVNSNEYYSKYIAIGKALGILKGVGDGTFKPETEITRQDMMVICARGMRIASKLSDEGADVTGFSDVSSIASYASFDIGAMVKKGIVKGNADGTINPLGYTTRAEAAVIMHRILNLI